MNSVEMKIIVTQADIDAAKKNSGLVRGFTCPIAIAVSRTIGKMVFVATDEVLFSCSGTPSKSSYLPQEVKNFILLYDSGKQVEPITFELAVW